MIYIMHVVAVVVILHVRRHICLIVSYMIRRMMCIVMWEVIPVVRRTPMYVLRAAKTVKQRRAFVVHRLDDIVRSVDVRRTDYLNVRCRIAHLYHQRSYILIDVRCQYGLDE